ncbi:LytR/AlgR family response regulator transcription factor [Algoriphagus namhaensis]
MIKVAILDDEPKSILSLTYELSLFGDRVKLVTTLTSVSEAVEKLRAEDIDCLFLDIEMPQMDGFRFLENFERKNFEVVFVTAYSEYAIQALREQAFDYLLKPVDGEDLDRVLTKLEGRLEQKEKELSPGKILLNTDQELRLIQIDDIVYCESEGSYTQVVLSTGAKVMVSKNLKHLQSLLPREGFFRIHHSFLINLKYFDLLDKSHAKVRMVTGEGLPLSRLRRKDFLALLRQKMKHN